MTKVRVVYHFATLAILSLVVIAMLGCAAKAPVPVKDWTIMATWNYDFANLCRAVQPMPTASFCPTIFHASTIPHPPDTAKYKGQRYP